jgi:hypothetical protein
MHETLGLLLVREGLITRPQLYEALRLQQTNNKQLGTCLVLLGYISAEQLLPVVSRQLGVPFVAPGIVANASLETFTLMPYELCVAYKLFPTRVAIDGVIELAICNTSVLAHLDAIATQIGYPVRAYLAMELEVEEAITRFEFFVGSRDLATISDRTDAAEAEAKGSAELDAVPPLRVPAPDEKIPLRSKPAFTPPPPAPLPAAPAAPAAAVNDTSHDTSEDTSAQDFDDEPPALVTAFAKVRAATSKVITADREISATDFGSALGLEPTVITDEIILLDRPVKIGTDVVDAALLTRAINPPRKVDTDQRLARLTVYDAVERLYSAANLDEVGRIVAQCLLSFFSRVAVFRHEADNLHLVVADGFERRIDKLPRIPLMEFPSLMQLCRDGKNHYGHPLGENANRLDELMDILKVRRPASYLIVPHFTHTHGLTFVTYADNEDLAELYDDLHDIELLFKDTQTAVDVLGQQQAAATGTA